MYRLFFLLPILFFSCRINYEEVSVVDKLPSHISTIEITNGIYDEIKKGIVIHHIAAKSLRVYSGPERVQLDDARIINRSDSDAKVELYGISRFAEYNRENRNAIIKDGIRAFYFPEKTNVIAQELYWKDSDRTLKSKEDDLVDIQKEDGSYLKGKSLVIDMKYKQISYEKVAEGLFSNKKNNQKEEVLINRDEESKVE